MPTAATHISLSIHSPFSISMCFQIDSILHRISDKPLFAESNVSDGGNAKFWGRFNGIRFIEVCPNGVGVGAVNGIDG